MRFVSYSSSVRMPSSCSAFSCRSALAGSVANGTAVSTVGSGVWVGCGTGGPVADTDGVLSLVFAAAQSHIAAQYDQPADDPVAAADFDLALLMLTARLYGRRQSPTGVAGVNDFGVVRASRVDPDIASLLAAYRNHSDV